jgi:hypothetical protein
MASTVLKLRKPIQAHGEAVNELTFREPTGKDIVAAGYPWKVTAGVDGKAERIVVAHAIQEYIVRLAGIPPSSVEALNALDWQDAMVTVANFFNDTTTEDSTAGS